MDRKNDDPHRWLVFGVIAVIYFFVYFHRMSTSVIVTDLLDSFHTNAAALGVMSSMYFYLYACEQPVVGFLADRLGPRRVIGWWTLAAAAGCFLFGLSPSVTWAAVGRALIGLGVGGVYVPALKAFSMWFGPREFTTMVGMLMAAGNLGAVVATTPLAWSASAWGWRPTFFLIGLVSLGLALAMLLLTREHPDIQDSIKKEAGSGPGLRRNTAAILRGKRFWAMAIIFVGSYGTLLTLQGLWAAPFLMSVLGIDRIYASNLNMLIPIGVIVGSPLIGWICGRIAMDKHDVLLIILGGYTLTWMLIIFAGAGLGVVGMAVDLLLMGVATGGFISVLWGILRETTPASILGLTSGLLNPSSFLGAAVLQGLTGAVLARAGRQQGLYPVAGFKHAFLLCLVVIGLCLLCALYLRQSRQLVLPEAAATGGSAPGERKPRSG